MVYHNRRTADSNDPKPRLTGSFGAWHNDRMNMRLLCLLLLSLPTMALADSPWPSLAEPPPRVGGGERDAALVIGIADYPMLKQPIPGADQNARDAYLWLTETRGVKTENVTLLVNAQAVREEILAAARRMATKVQPGGAMWVVFVGHGAPAADGRDGVLVGADAQQTPRMLYARSITQTELRQALSGGRAATRVLVLDSCFSGKVSDLASVAPGLQPTLVADRATMAPQGFTVSTAGTSQQFAGPLPGLARPAFSYLFLGALRGWGDDDGNGRVTAGEAAAYAKRALASLGGVTGRSQTPEILGDASVPLARGAHEPGPKLSRLVASLSGVATGPVPTATGGDLSSLDVERLQHLERTLEAQRARLRADWAQASKLLPLSIVSRAEKLRVIQSLIERYAGLSGEPEHAAARQALARLRDGQEFVAAASAGMGPTGYVAIQPGRFIMGSPPSEEGRDGDETAHRARITRGFWLKETEVTQGEWAPVMGSNPSPHGACGSANCPVVHVSWLDAVTYCNRLSEREGLPQCYTISRTSATFAGLSCRGYRLPTEAEWEYAARAGTTGARYGPLDAIAWTASNSGPSLQPVGRKQPNAWGLYDMLGNVWEWTQDSYGKYERAAADPTGPKLRVFRGGSWNARPSHVRAAIRSGDLPHLRYGHLGFRPARSFP